jgi:hypothetical protein
MTKMTKDERDELEFGARLRLLERDGIMERFIDDDGMVWWRPTAKCIAGVKARKGRKTADTDWVDTDWTPSDETGNA